MKILSLRPSVLPLYFLLILFFSSAQVLAQTVQVRVYTDSLTIGETFNFSLSLQLDQEYQKVEYPDTNSFPSSIELIERQQFKVSEFSDSLIYKLQYFGNEDVQIPPLPVTLFTENDSARIYTNPVTLYFKSIVAEGDTTLKPMKPNFAFSRPWWPWILAGAILAAFLAWWFLLRKQPEKPVVVPEPEIQPFHNPLKELEQSLMEIKNTSNLSKTRNFKKFYSEIGDAIRSYFEDLYQIPALESTSTELLRYLEAYGVDDTLTEKTRTILRKADLVKFAKYSPSLDDAWNTFDNANEFLERAKLVDSARIARLKTKYNEQFVIASSQKENEES